MYFVLYINLYQYCQLEEHKLICLF